MLSSVTSYKSPEPLTRLWMLATPTLVYLTMRKIPTPDWEKPINDGQYRTPSTLWEWVHQHGIQKSISVPAYFMRCLL